MSTPRTGLYEVKLKLKGKERKWSEKYFLGAASEYATLETAAKAIATHRRLLLADGFSIYDVAMHNLGAFRDRHSVVGAAGAAVNLSTEAGPPVAIVTCNNVETCLNVMFETTDGLWAVKQFRGLRDDWIEDDECIITPTMPSPGTVPVIGTSDAAGQTAAVALGQFLNAVLYYDKLKKIDDSAPGISYDTFAWATCALDGVGTRQTGVGRDHAGRR